MNPRHLLLFLTAVTMMIRYPNGNVIARNHAHETGVYTKQTSCYAHQLSANASIVDNVCYNGPRAGVNVNDGFGGGNLFQGNVVFNSVRETGDHGPYNSWCVQVFSHRFRSMMQLRRTALPRVQTGGPAHAPDLFPLPFPSLPPSVAAALPTLAASAIVRDRQPYLTLSGVVDGFGDPQGRSIIKANDTNTGNLMLNGYNGVWSTVFLATPENEKELASSGLMGGCTRSRCA